MTRERNFDRIAKAWLELGPVEAPGRVIADVVLAVETAPQVRRSTFAPAWRPNLMTRARMAAAVAAVLIVAVAGVYLLSRNNNVGPTPTSSPALAPSATPASPPATASEVPLPSASITVTQRLVFAWPDPAGPSAVDYQVITEVRNDGAGWALVRPHAASYSFRNSSGTATSGSAAFGSFVPTNLEPGKTGYLLDITSWPGHSVADLASVDVTVGPASFQSVAPPSTSFAVSNITWLSASSGPGLIAKGTVSGAGTATMPFAYVAILCIGKDGSILGATTQTLKDLAASQSTAFQTVASTPPLKPSDCVTSRGLVGVGVSQD